MWKEEYNQWLQVRRCKVINSRGGTRKKMTWRAKKKNCDLKKIKSKSKWCILRAKVPSRSCLKKKNVLKWNIEPIVVMGGKDITNRDDASYIGLRGHTSASNVL